MPSASDSEVDNDLDKGETFGAEQDVLKSQVFWRKCICYR